MDSNAAAMRETLKKKLGCTDADLAKPLPVPSAWSRPFWEAARRHELVLRRCTRCGHVDHPPYLHCTECGSEESEWTKASGKARLYAFAVNTYGVDLGDGLFGQENLTSHFTIGDEVIATAGDWSFR